MYTIFQKTLETRYEHLISNANNISFVWKKCRHFQGIRLSVQINPPIRLRHRNKAKIIICLTIVSPARTNCWHKSQLLVNAKCHLTLLFKPKNVFLRLFKHYFLNIYRLGPFCLFFSYERDKRGANPLVHNQHADSRIMCDIFNCYHPQILRR